MKKTILIAPFDGPYAAALAAEARAAGWSIVVALRSAPGSDVVAAPRPAPGSEAGAAPRPASGDAAPAPVPAAPADSLVLPWNPGSFVSASALLIAARNALGELDAAVILSEPGAMRADLLGGKPGEIEAAIQDATLGPALLVRELARRFEARKTGDILLLGAEPPEDAPLGPAAALAAGAFRGLGEGLFVAAAQASYEAYGVSDKGGDPAQAARFAIRLLDERKSGKSGRWLRFGGKAGIFGVF